MEARQQRKSASQHDLVVKGLKEIYKRAVRPVEEMYHFDKFYSPLLEDADFDAKPIVLLLGQYSVGKTSFVRHIIKRDFPGIRIGPEPTTDRFTCVMYGEQDQVVPGNALCVASDRPFRGLNKFGTTFLSRLEGAVCNSPVLKDITFVDTPGVLAGAKQRIGRQYDFTAVIEWFAARADRILLLFDAHKLDISDEFKRSIEALRGHDDKIRVVLNKSDTVGAKELMRVYGALMWSLGKVVNTPEVLRVYTGSFWEKPLREDHDFINLFHSEAADLMSDLNSLPRNSAVRKVNELVKRARLAIVHAHVIGHLRGKLPAFFRKSSKIRELLKDLPAQFNEIVNKYNLPAGDLPNPARFKEVLDTMDLSKFPKLNKKALERLERAIANDIPALMQPLKAGRPAPPAPASAVASNPFAAAPSSPDDRQPQGPIHQDWGISIAEKTEFDNIFYGAPLQDNKLTGEAARQVFASSGATNDVLFKVWTLADIDKNNMLDAEEFAVAMHLLRGSLGGKALPESLPPALVPPSHRSAFPAGPPSPSRKASLLSSSS